MSVFAGFVAKDNYRPKPEVTRQMLSQYVAPRLTDTDQYSDHSIDLGVRYSPELHGLFSNERLVIAADCRLDPDQGLYQELSSFNEPLKPEKFLAAAYSKWGDDLARHISGEFAYAIWDKLDRKLTCARDRFGQKPLSYILRPEGLYIASDFLPLASALGHILSINDSWVIEYLNGVAADQNSTPFNGVNRLPPGCVLKWQVRDA